MSATFNDPEHVRTRLAEFGYLCDEECATAVFLAQKLERPLLCEGPPGVGKTELAKATSRALGCPLVRLQCYEGLDESKALYEWRYAKQMLYIQMLQQKVGALTEESTSLGDAVQALSEQDDAFFGDNFLQARPLLQALQSESPVVLLIDEVDRAEEELEALFLEVLGEFQLTIPELGTVVATHRPLVFLTSNHTREMSEALRRRCLHLFLDMPTRERELQIVQHHLPDLCEKFGNAVVDFVHKVRGLGLQKPPSISETIDWARALQLLGAQSLNRSSAENTLSVLAKHKGDREQVAKAVQDLPQ